MNINKILSYLPASTFRGVILLGNTTLWSHGSGGLFSNAGLGRHGALSCLLLICGLFAGWSSPASAAEFCSDEYYINVTLPNQARWDMCWEHRQREGLVYHKIHYTPRNGARRMILNEAAVAQIHVPYDDNGARYHDVTDYGLGERYMVGLTQEECPDGKLLKLGSKNVACQQTETRDTAYHYGAEHLQGDALSLFSVSKIGAYNYILVWRFLDNGAIEPGMGATGALQRFGNSDKEKHGWLIGANKIGLAHLHNFFWKLDFDLAGTSDNDYVEEINFIQENGQTKRVNSRYLTEKASKVSPATLRRWRIADGDLKAANGQPISYEIRLHQAEHQDIGPESEPFTHNDLYVTKFNRCELFASHNPTHNGCAADLSEFVDGENLNGEDLVVWPSTTFYHMPRAEDAPRMDAHWSFISITPRDWHNNNPLSDAAESGGSGNSDSGNGGSGSTTTTVLHQENFESGSSGWIYNPNTSDTASKGQWELGNPQATSHRGLTIQRDSAYQGNHALVTGAAAGIIVGSNDVDGGITSIRSPVFSLPANHRFNVKLAYYFAHLSNSTATDFLRITAVNQQGNRKVLLLEKGTSTDRGAQWKILSSDISDMAGSNMWLLIEAADGGNGSIVEAAVDAVRIEQVSGGTSGGDTGGSNTGTHGETVFSDDFESDLNWTLNPNGDDEARAGNWGSGVPAITRFQNVTVQPGPVAGNSSAMTTGYAAGITVGTHDIDGGKTSIRSPLIRLPAGSGYQLTLDYYFAHLWNTTAADYFSVHVVRQSGQRQQILHIDGQPENRPGVWRTLTHDLSSFAGNSIYLDIETADNGAGSIVEAGFDNLRITYQ